MSEKCALQYSSTMLGVVVACNFVKVVCMIATALFVWDLEEPIFATVGDAVASYLKTPDETTTDLCLMGRTEAKAWASNSLKQDDCALYNPPKRRPLFSATSKSRYLITMGLCTLYLTTGLVLLHFATVHGKEHLTASQVWALGLGEINANNSIEILGRYRYGELLLINILIANSFQLALSITYFLYNALYTAQCGAMEWASYALKKRPLRVTHPRGEQRSTCWLQLPYTYSLLLSIFLMLMHFLISQAVFIAHVQWYTELGEPSEETSNVGFSPVGILASCCVGAFLIVVQVLHSLRPLEARMPVHGNKSVVISAACHPGVSSYHDDHGETMRDAETDMAMKAVMWGAVVQPNDDNSLGHCSLTSASDHVEMPVKGKMYQGQPS